MKVIKLDHAHVLTILYLTVTIALWNIIYSLNLIKFAVLMKRNVGAYIEMIIEGYANTLLLVVSCSALLCGILNVACLYCLYKVFQKIEQPNMMKVLYSFVLISIGTICILLITCIMLIMKANFSSTVTDAGILEAMNNYRSNSLIKSKIDALQVQFQCCGSMKYNEWFEIEWYDTNLIETSKYANDYKYQAPFSCCSIKSFSPCIHHNIRSSDLPYKYTKEQNFSLSIGGCFDTVVELKKNTQTSIFIRLFFLILTQILMLIGVRLLQTAHLDNNGILYCPAAKYEAWLFSRPDQEDIPPPVPPIPKEFMDEEY